MTPETRASALTTNRTALHPPPQARPTDDQPLLLGANRLDPPIVPMLGTSRGCVTPSHEDVRPEDLPQIGIDPL